MATFEIDYRQPEQRAGLGHITHPNGDMELIHYKRYSLNDFDYKEFHYFDTWLEELEDWQPIFELLRARRVDTVFDPELACSFKGDFNEAGETPLETWIAIITKACGGVEV